MARVPARPNGARRDLHHEEGGGERAAGAAAPPGAGPSAFDREPTVHVGKATGGGANSHTRLPHLRETGGPDGRAAHARRPLRSSPRLPVRAQYTEVPDGGGRCASTTRRGRPTDADRAAPPRRAPLVVPLPHMIPVLIGAGHRAVAPDLVGFGRSDKPARATTTRTPATSTGSRRTSSTSSTSATSRSCARTGAGSSASASSPSSRTASPASSRRTPSCPPATPPERGLPRVAEVLARRCPRSRSGASSTAAAPPTSPPRSSRPTTPRSRRDATRRERASSRPRPGLPRRPRARQPRRLGGAVRLRPAVPLRLQRRRPHHRRQRAALIARIPGCEGPAHTTIKGGGHFLQEDRGPELAQVAIDLIGRR